MKIRVAGYHCSPFTDDDNLPKPDEEQIFEGPEEVVEAEATLFASRFVWAYVNVEEE